MSKKAMRKKGSRVVEAMMAGVERGRAGADAALYCYLASRGWLVRVVKNMSSFLCAMSMYFKSTFVELLSHMQHCINIKY